MVGEGSFVSHSNLGGSSKHFVAKSLTLARAVQGLGFPGSSSHRNGTDADELWSGGVSIPEGSVECISDSGAEKSGSLGVKLLNGSAAVLPISDSLSLPLSVYVCGCFAF